MANVYLAREEGPNGAWRYVAVKCLAARFAGDPTLRRLLEYEATLSRLLDHPNIIRTLGMEAHGSQLFLRLEYVPGCDLGSFLLRATERGASPDPRLAAYFALQLCRALKYAHALTDPRTGETLDLVHRDVSPSNILVSYWGQVKLIDFGIAKARGRSKFTDTGFVRGKIEFMAPEVRTGRGADRRSDLFSAVKVLYFLLHPTSCLAPEPEGTEPETLLSLDLPPVFREIFVRGLQSDPAKRFQSAEELEQALQPLAAPRTLLEEKMQSLFREEIAQEKIAEIQPAPRSSTLRSALEPTVLAEPEAPVAPLSRRSLRSRLRAISLVLLLLVGAEGLAFWAHESLFSDQMLLSVVRKYPKISQPVYFGRPAVRSCLVHVKTLPRGARLSLDGKYFGGISPTWVNIPCDTTTLLGFSAAGHPPTFVALRPDERTSKLVVLEKGPGAVAASLLNVAQYLLEKN
jgi:serine/threonine-protein kinase